MTAAFLRDIPYCGGPDPLVHVAATRVTVVIPEHPPNRGEGLLPGETYIYTAGSVARVR